jgi:hypothetical protein
VILRNATPRCLSHRLKASGAYGTSPSSASSLLGLVLLRPPSRQSVRRLEGIQSFAQNSKPEGCCTWDPSPGFCSQRCSAGASFLLPIIYPNVGQEVVSFAFWGLLIVASVQPAKVLNSGLGQRDFTKWRGHEVCSFKPSDRELSCWASLLSGLLYGTEPVGSLWLSMRRGDH